MNIEFTKDLYTGNAQIDTEHKELIRAINQLLDACKSGKGRAQLETSINFLSAYTKKHFSNEEKLQLASKYPKYIAHKKWHNEFIAEVETLLGNLRRDGANILLVAQVNTKVAALITHIRVIDVALAKHIKESV